MIIKGVIHVIDVFKLLDLTTIDTYNNKFFDTINLLCTSFFYYVSILITIERTFATIRAKTYEKEISPWFGIFLTIIMVKFYYLFSIFFLEFYNSNFNSLGFKYLKG